MRILCVSSLYCALVVLMATSADTVNLIFNTQQYDDPPFWYTPQICTVVAEWIPSNSIASALTCENGTYCVASSSLFTGIGTCIPCWRACLELAFGPYPPSPNAYYYFPGSKTCNCVSQASVPGGIDVDSILDYKTIDSVNVVLQPCSSSSFCPVGTFCSPVNNGTYCLSCYYCFNDTNSVSGSCKESCSFVPRSTFPSVGLLYAPELEVATRSVVVALMYARQLFLESTNSLQVDQGAFSIVLKAAGLTELSAAQVQFAYSQIQPVNGTEISTEDFVRQYVAKEYAYENFCPPLPAMLSASVTFPGCACLLDTAEVFPEFATQLAAYGLTSSNATRALCPVGYRCSNNTYNDVRYGFMQRWLPPFAGVCVPCLYGEFCKRGTIERKPSTLRTCTLNTTSDFNKVANSDPDRPTPDSLLTICGNLRPCPAGKYCPTPALIHACPIGSFCNEATTFNQSCNFTFMLDYLPLAYTIAAPQMVILAAFGKNMPLAGNECPGNASDPYTKCPAGHYCPTPGESYVCPKNHFCPAWSVEPKKCTFLLDCTDEGISSPKVVWWGFVLFFLIILFLPAVVIVYNWTGIQKRTRQQKHDAVLDFLSALGFKIAVDKKPKPASSVPVFTTRPEVPFRGDSIGHDTNGVAVAAHSSIRRPSFRLNNSIARFKSAWQGLAMDQEPGNAEFTLEQLVSVRFDKLGLRLKTGKRVLSDVTGIFPHSQMHAIMGPSGSGKTTFMTTLCGKASYGIMDGTVDMLLYKLRKATRVKDELPVPHSFDSLRYITGFVPQEDIVHETLTVRENLAFTARLRLPNTTTRSEMSGIVRAVIKTIGLHHVQHSVVGSVENRGISGGQRKRVNIGMELVARPSLLFLDEPTSGLDSSVSQEIVECLYNMCLNSGLNIVTVIHQPRNSIFQRFHDVLLLGEGGITVFQGPVDLAADYFNCIGFRLPMNENPADFYLDVISGMVQRVPRVNGKVDEDFTQRELFVIWRKKGAEWLKLAMEAKEKVQQMGEMNEELLGRTNSMLAQERHGTGSSKEADLGTAMPTMPEGSHEGMSSGQNSNISSAIKLPSLSSSVVGQLPPTANFTPSITAAVGPINSAINTNMWRNVAMDVLEEADRVSESSEPDTSSKVPSSTAGKSMRQTSMSRLSYPVKSRMVPSITPQEAKAVELYLANKSVLATTKTGLPTLLSQLRSVTPQPPVVPDNVQNVPWKPREMQAIQDKFALLDTDRNEKLGFSEFVSFWAGARALMDNDDEFLTFLAQCIDLFQIKSIKTEIDMESFMAGIKRRLRDEANPDKELEEASKEANYLAKEALNMIKKGKGKKDDGQELSLEGLRHIFDRNVKRVTTVFGKEEELEELAEEAELGVQHGHVIHEGEEEEEMKEGLKEERKKALEGQNDSTGTSSVLLNVDGTSEVPSTPVPSRRRKRDIARDVGRSAMHSAALLGSGAKWGFKVVAASMWAKLKVAVAAFLGRKVGGRRLPSVFKMGFVVLQRSMVKWANAFYILLLDLALVTLLGLAMGAVQGYTSSYQKVPQYALMAVLAFGLLMSVTSLRTFGAERVIFLQRETYGGLFTLSYMCGLMTWDFLALFLYPALYLAFYYSMTVFPFNWGLYYLLLVMVAWWAYGVGYMCSVLFDRVNALMASVTVSLFFGGIINGVNPSLASSSSNLLLKVLLYPSYTRWAVEAITVGYMTPFTEANVWQAAGVLATVGYCHMENYIPTGGELGGFSMFNSLFVQPNANVSSLSASRRLMEMNPLRAFWQPVPLGTLDLGRRLLQSPLLNTSIAAFNASNLNTTAFNTSLFNNSSPLFNASDFNASRLNTSDLLRNLSAAGNLPPAPDFYNFSLIPPGFDPTTNQSFNDYLRNVTQDLLPGLLPGLLSNSSGNWFDMCGKLDVTSSAELSGACLLYAIYKEPWLVKNICSPWVRWDYLALLICGIVSRVITFCILELKVLMRATK